MWCFCKKIFCTNRETIWGLNLTQIDFKEINLRALWCTGAQWANDRVNQNTTKGLGNLNFPHDNQSLLIIVISDQRLLSVRQQTLIN